MAQPKFNDLLECGTHFGHLTSRWNPKMKPYILTARNGIYIIDLQKTLDAVSAVCKAVERKIKAGESILFVGTKKQARDIIKEEAERCGMFYVNHRWLGGMLTNFQTVRSSIQKLDEIDQMEQNDRLKLLPKKEVIRLMKKREKLLAVLGGVRNMKRLPGLVFIIDAKKEHIAVSETNCLGIEVAAMVDTNTDPDPVTYPIPGNDDAMKSIRLITKAIADAVLTAKTGIEPPAEEKKPVEKETKKEEAAVEKQPDKEPAAEEKKEVKETAEKKEEKKETKEKKVVKKKKTVKRKKVETE